MTLETVPGWARELLDGGRVGRLGFLDEGGAPRVLPVTYAVAEELVWSAVDHKPKRPGEPARVRFLRRDPRAALCVDRYSDDWERLAWVQLLGAVDVVEVADAAAAVAALEEKYPPYRARSPGGPLLRLRVERALHWRAD